MRNPIHYFLHAFLDLFFPKLCMACSRHLSENEEMICLHCEFHLPQTHYLNFGENPIEKLFWGRVQLKAAGSLYHYEKGQVVQKLMQHLKYKGKKEVGRWMGEQLGKALIDNQRFKHVELVLAIPLHPKKEFKRGFNQSDLIVKGILNHVSWKEEKVIHRKINTATQTKKSKFERWQNVSSSFNIKEAKKIQNKHILLVDDVLTTGATLEAAALLLLQHGAKSISVVTVAAA